MFSATVPDSTRGSWATYPTWLGRRNTSGASIGSPFQHTSPLWCTMPASARSSDDLPAPTGPTTNTSSPRSTVRSTSCAPTVPFSCTALNPRSSSRCSGRRGALGGAGAVPAERSTPGTSDEYAAVPDIATVRLVQTRADGSCDTNEAVVQANHRAAPSVPTAISVAAEVSWPFRYSAQDTIGSR